jgi:hypothetical protein
MATVTLDANRVEALSGTLTGNHDGGEGSCPVVGVLLAVCQIQAGPSISASRGQPELATGRFPGRRAVTNEPV